MGLCGRSKVLSCIRRIGGSRAAICQGNLSIRDLGCTVLVALCCKSVSVLSIHHVSIDTHHEAISLQQCDDFSRGKLALGQSPIRSLPHLRDILCIAFGKRRQHIENLIELLGGRLSIDAANDRHPSARPLLQRQRNHNTFCRKQVVQVLFQRDLGFCFCHITPFSSPTEQMYLPRIRPHSGSHPQIRMCSYLLWSRSFSP